ncbi:hypothetical protein APSETT445_003849 [Aspergillus pseudonomiae]
MVKLIILPFMSGLTLALAATSITAADNALLRRDFECDSCTLVTGEIIGQLGDERDGAAVVQAMEKACPVLPMDPAECQNYIDVYGNMMVQLIQQNLTPSEEEINVFGSFG